MSIHEIAQNFRNFCTKYIPPLSEFSHCFCPNVTTAFARISNSFCPNCKSNCFCPKLREKAMGNSGKSNGNSGKSNGKICAKAMKRRHIFRAKNIDFARISNCFFLKFLGGTVLPPPPPPPTPMLMLMAALKRTYRKIARKL